MSQAPFYVDPVLTAVVQAYRNGRMIADDVLPRVSVSRPEYAYLTYPKADAFTVPDTLVARKGNVNEVEMTSSRQTGLCVAHALDDAIPMEDYGRAPGRDLNGEAAEWLASLLAIGREKRAADLAFAAASYGSNTVNLTSNDRWDVDHADSDPIVDIGNALDSMVMRGNIMVIGRKPWSYLQRHPTIVRSIFGNSSEAGIAPKRAVADLFELEDIHIGEGWINSAAKGQTASLTRLWGNHCALIYRDQLATTQRGITFGFSPTSKAREGSTYFNPQRGAQGSTVVRVSEEVDEVIVSSDCGYLITNATS